MGLYFVIPPYFRNITGSFTPGVHGGGLVGGSPLEVNGGGLVGGSPPEVWVKGWWVVLHCRFAAANLST